MAIRDCNKALSIDPSSLRANFCMSEALLQVLIYWQFGLCLTSKNSCFPSRCLWLHPYAIFSYADANNVFIIYSILSTSLVFFYFFLFLLTAHYTLQLGKLKEALDYAMAAQNLAPSNSEASDRVNSIKEQLTQGLSNIVIVYALLFSVLGFLL